MLSSPTEEGLGRIGGLYDRACEAQTSEDLGLVQELLDRVQAELGDLDLDAMRELPASAKTAAASSHARLVAAIEGAQQHTRSELQAVRAGGKALKVYGHRTDPVGTRLQDEA